MKRLLFLLPSIPDPPDTGAKLRNCGLLRLAAAEHAVDVIAFGSPDAEPRLEQLANRSLVVPPPARRAVLARALSTLQSPLPDMAQRLWSVEFQGAVHCWVSATDYDGVQAEGIEMARYLWAAAPERRIYDAHNPEFLLQRRASEAAPGRLAALYSRLQWRRLQRFERSVVRTSRMTLAVSHHDANQLEALAGPASASIHVVPSGITTAEYPFREPRPTDAPNLVFIGTFAYRPNAEAQRWFLDRVLPRVWQHRPQARLFAVGAAPPAWLIRAGQRDDRIAVTGHVGDERAYLARAAALVLPLRVAAGARLKALVAMASGVPIVSTRLGMEGLEAVPGTHYLQAETADEWVAALDRLLDDVALRRRLAEAGRALVEGCYDWTAITPALQAAYVSLGEA